MTVSQHPDHVTPFKERVKREREQEILDAARDIFSTDGYARASMDDIAERVGIAKGTVYLHFSTKEELLKALLSRMACQLVEESNRRIAGQPDALAKLRAIAKLLVDHRVSNASLGRVLTDEVPHFVGNCRHEGVGAALRSTIAAVVEEGQAEGSIDRRVDAIMASKALLLLVFMASPGEASSAARAKQELLSQVSRLYFHGICGNGEDEQ